MLFGKPRPTAQRSVIVQKVIYVQQQLPLFMTRLKVLCTRPEHPLPCLMTFMSRQNSSNGAPVAMYRCSLCNHSEAWVRDYTSGKPRRLFAK